MNIAEEEHFKMERYILARLLESRGITNYVLRGQIDSEEEYIANVLVVTDEEESPIGELLTYTQASNLYENEIALYKLDRLRFFRNRKLSETDWTQNADVPQSTRDRWATYRQELRDITISNQNLNGVVWPTKPE